ncbi:hypothetical protein EDC04DRAFT_1612927 [Pisolithus marmoratus]|nr:hypothetical protein EDC04DRAFT_1612927 [Pisolithus marmoratus]
MPAFAHIITQTRQNIELLIAHRKISEEDGRVILAKLSRVGPPSRTPIGALAEQTSHLNISSNKPGVARVEAKALWDWLGEDPSYLNFRAGEVIEIIKETDADWWIGRNRAGKQGSFPSAYVERLGSPSSEKVSTPPFPDIPKLDTPFAGTRPVHTHAHPGPSQQYPTPSGLPYPPPPGPPPELYIPPPGPLHHHGPQAGASHQYRAPYYPATGPTQPAVQKPPKQGKFGN